MFYVNKDLGNGYYTENLLYTEPDLIERTDNLGVVYKSVSRMCKAYGVPLSEYKRRRNLLKWTKDKALTYK